MNIIIKKQMDMQIVDKSKEIIMKYFYSMTYRSYFNYLSRSIQRNYMMLSHI